MKAEPYADYVTADIVEDRAMVTLDITAIDRPDAHFDAIWCSHVLEHVPDDVSAMREMHRILRPGGWALIMVPIHDSPTDEDPSITDPEERDRRFGQTDHVRYYGMDIVDRFDAAGFRTEVLTAADLLPADGRARHGVEVDDVLFVCWAN